MPGSDIGIDLGTSSILIYVEKKGILLNEPTVVAVDKETDEILAMGLEAKRMVGRTPGRIEVIYPMANGVISDCTLIEEMLLYFLKKVSLRSIFMHRVWVCIPGIVSDVERRAVVNAVHAAGVRKIYLLDEPVAAAIGAGENVRLPHGIAVLDIGAGTSDMAVISMGGVAAGNSIRVAGNRFDEAVIQYCRREFDLIIGERTAENTKNTIGCVMPRQEKLCCRIKGRCASSGLPIAVTIDSDQILEALHPVAEEIVEALMQMLEETPPELMSDIHTDGLLLTGGGAHLYGFDQLIREKTGLPVRIPPFPELCVAKGTGKVLKYMDGSQPGDGKINPLWQENTSLLREY